MNEMNTEHFGWLSGNEALDPVKKTILFLHGAGQNSRFWTQQLNALSHRFNTVALDLPGHNRSEGPSLKNIPEMAEAVRQFIAEAKLPNPVPCGLSMGGAIVLQMLLDEPERFKEAILINTGAKLKVLPEILDAVKHNYEAYRTALFHFGVPSANRTDEVKLAIHRASEPTGDAAYTDLLACDAFDVMDRLHTISARTLVVGSEKDLSTPLKYAKVLRDKINYGSFSIIEGCGHFSPLESPDEVSQVMEDFLSGV